MSTMIRNLIFDVGNVLLDYRWKQMFMDRGLPEAEAITVGSYIFDSDLWVKLDLGSLSINDAATYLSHKNPQYAEQITWFLNHGELMSVGRPDVWKRVRELKEMGYGIYLLSNYCEELFLQHTKNASFMSDIDGMVVSYQIGLVKPDERIYRYLLEEYMLFPEECIFYDDREDNTKGAEAVGISSVTVSSKAQLLGSLDARLAAPAPPIRASHARPSHTSPAAKC